MRRSYLAWTRAAEVNTVMLPSWSLLCAIALVADERANTNTAFSVDSGDDPRVWSWPGLAVRFTR